MNITSTEIPEVKLVTPRVFGDSRGYFFETYHAERYAELGLEARFVQDNVSRSQHGTLRGLHLQSPHGQGKLVWVLMGEVYDVAVDVRVGSPTFGRFVGQLLSEENHLQLYVPPGFAHGFVVTSEHAIFAYKCTDFYHPEAEVGVAWNDPAIGIAWPVEKPLLSDKDRKHPPLADIDPSRLPRHEG